MQSVLSGAKLQLSVLVLLAFGLAGCGRGMPLPTELPAPTAVSGPEPATPTVTAWPPTRTRQPTVTPVPTAIKTPSPSPTPTSTLSVLQRTDNILVLGKDQRPGDADPTWRTDTIMVVAVDHAAAQIGVISIPRDLYVDIPELGKARINQADYYGAATGYPGGGEALVRRVLTETLGIPTQHYVRIEWNGLERLVDALGGVTVTLECPLYERVPVESSPNGVEDWTLPAGQVHLDGATAKKFATYRYVTSDFGRAQRQQQLLWAIRDRALQLDTIARLPDLWKALSDAFKTDLGLLDVIKLARLGISLDPNKVHGLVLGEDMLDYYVTEEGAWVLVVKDQVRLEEEQGRLFSAQSLAQIGVPGPGHCPPSPTAVATFTPTPDHSPTPTATASPGK